MLSLIDNLHVISHETERPAATGFQIRSKHSSCRSQYLHTAKRVITELYKLDIKNTAGCARRVAYLLEEDRFTCPSSNYQVVFRHSQDHF